MVIKRKQLVVGRASAEDWRLAHAQPLRKASVGEWRSRDVRWGWREDQVPLHKAM